MDGWLIDVEPSRNLTRGGPVILDGRLGDRTSRRTIPASERTLEPTEVVVRFNQPV
jgi:predicted kinase